MLEEFIVANDEGPVAQLGWSVRLITERSRVQISPGPFWKHLLRLTEHVTVWMLTLHSFL